METTVIVLNVILAVILVILVLLQRSEGGALGLGLSQDNFASTRTVGNFLTKSTAVIAALFIISSISLVILSRGDLEEKQSVIERIEEVSATDLKRAAQRLLKSKPRFTALGAIQNIESFDAISNRLS